MTPFANEDFLHAQHKPCLVAGSLGLGGRDLRVFAAGARCVLLVCCLGILCLCSALVS